MTRKDIFREDGRPRNGGLLGPLLDEYAVRANTVLCPFCQKRINKEAVKCGFCNEWLVAPEKAIEIAKKNEADAEREAKGRRYFWGAVVALGVIAIAINRLPNPTTDPASSTSQSTFEKKPITPEEEKASLLADAESSPEKFLTLSKTSAWKGGFDTVILLSGTLKSSAPIPIKDPRITCYLLAESGTALGSVTDTIFKVIPAGKSVRFKANNMGFADSRWQRYACAVESATAISAAR